MFLVCLYSCESLPIVGLPDTGSGKTYTVLGHESPAEQAGLLPRIAEDRNWNSSLLWLHIVQLYCG